MLERFQLLVFLMMIALYNLNSYSWTLSRAVLEEVGIMVFVVWMMEVVVDWMKHAFVIKFNRIHSPTYFKFGTVLATEVIHASHQGPESSYNVPRRIGFVSIPLVCLVWFYYLHPHLPSSL